MRDHRKLQAFDAADALVLVEKTQYESLRDLSDNSCKLLNGLIHWMRGSRHRAEGRPDGS